MIVVDVVVKTAFFNILLLILLSSCLTPPIHQEYIQDTQNKDAIIIAKIYNHSIGVVPPEDYAMAVLYEFLNFFTTKHIRNTNLEIGSEIILGYEGCGKEHKKYVIGSKLTNAFKSARNPAEYYQYKPEYDVVYIKAGKYKLCNLRHYRFIEYNQEYEFEEFNIEQINSWYIFNSEDVIYLGDIYINKKEYKENMKMAEVYDFLRVNHPELLDRLKYSPL